MDNNDKRVRAWDWNTEPKILAELASDKSSDVRYWVGKNPSTPPEALAQLASDKHEYVNYPALTDGACGTLP